MKPMWTMKPTVKPTCSSYETHADYKTYVDYETHVNNKTYERYDPNT